MINYTAARRNMVDSQIHPSGVVNPAILEAFSTVPRENFVPESMRGMAYTDEDLVIGQGYVLTEPALLARMMSTADIRPDDIILNIGDTTGYSSAVLSLLATTVVTIEARPGMLDPARAGWAEPLCCNIAVIPGDPLEGCPEHAPYSLIFMNGAVADIPDIIPAQLTLHGRLIAVHQPSGAKIGTVVMMERIGEDQFATRKFFSAATPYITGFEPLTEFVF